MNDEEASGYLAPMCDIILSNSREIRIRADDTVMAFYDHRPYMIRRSRGYSPLPIVAKEESNHAVLGIGGGTQKRLLPKCKRVILSIAIYRRYG